MITRHLGGVDPEAFAVGAPPVYGEHQLDLLYSDLPTGYLTPVGGMSGISTPFSQSRRGSADNLVSINAMASTSSLSATLQSRLSNLNPSNAPSAQASSAQVPASSDFAEESPPIRAKGLPTYQEQLDTSNLGGTPQDPSDTLSRRTSDNNSEHSRSGPQHFEFSPEQLCKVPSYSTALRSHPQTPISEVPPTYQSATRQVDPVVSNSSA